MGNKGQSLVELGIAFVFIMILLSGAVETSMALFQFIQLRDAAQEGALYGSICQNNVSIEDRARNSSQTPLKLTSPDVKMVITYKEKTSDADKPLSDIEVGDGVRVDMQYAHKTFMPFVQTAVYLKAHITDTILQVNQSC